MRIVNSVLGDATGGRWQVVCEYSRLLAGRGHRVLMLLGSTHPPDTATIPPDVEVMVVRNHGHYDFPAAWRTGKRLRPFAPDIAIAHCSRSVALLRRALGPGTPLVAVSHSNKVKRLLPADAYLALTAHIEMQIRRYRRSASRPCYIVPNLVRLPASTALRETLPARVRHRPLTIGALGRFDTVKGFDVYLEALGELRVDGLEFQALLAGEGSESASLRAQAQRLGLQQELSFPGWINDTGPFLAQLDMLCVPARSDAFGLTPLQAAAAGVPLVLSRVSGHCEMFEENSEALFSGVGDAQSTAVQLMQLANDPDLAERLRQAAFQRVKRCYTENAVADSFFYAIDNIVKTCFSRH